MAFRRLAALLPGLFALTFTIGTSLAAGNTEAARSVALEALKSRLSARTDLVAGAVPRSRPRPVPTGSLHASRDPIDRRLDIVFDMVAPDAAPPDAQYAPPPRARPRDADALAYAARPARSRAGGGLSAIEELVEKHAEANDVPPALAQALVQVESSHNPKATGRNGEIGLLQIKPKTARAMGYTGSAKALYDPETNLTWGMKYLGKAHDLSGGDVCGTLLRYNAGLDAKRKSAASNKFCSKVKSVMAKRA